MTPASRSEDGEQPAGELPSTAYAVLGMLAVKDEALTVGEIKNRAGFLIRQFYWSPAISHIRRELQRLMALGMVEEHEIELGPVRRAQVYQTTERGTRALARWVAGSPPEEAVVVKNSVLLRVFLGAEAEPEVVLAIIDARLAEVDRDIDQSLWGQRRTSELGLHVDERLRFPRAVGGYVLRGLYFEQANLRQLRAEVEGFDTAAFSQDDRHERGPLRPRQVPDRTDRAGS
jgi:DNA-binding PadR family transcriptional regulator